MLFASDFQVALQCRPVLSLSRAAEEIRPAQENGDKINYARIPDQYLKASSLEHGIQTRIYQMTMWHKLFADPLNVVIIVKTNLKTQARAHVVLFSSDLDLVYDQLIDYYRLRFQIEFNFRLMSLVS